MSFGTGFGTSFGTPQPAPGGFSFGAQPPAVTSGSTLFATQPAPQQPTLGFGAPAAAPAAPTNTGFSFGTAVPAAAPAFGSTQGAATSGLGAPSTGLGAANTSGFGTVPATSAPAFGMLGQPASAASTAGFGLSFGAPQTSQAPAPSLGLSFGVPQPATTATTGFGLSFGAQPITTTGTGGFTLGGTANTAPLGLNFGASTATTTAGLSFGTTTASSGLGFGLGATTTTGFSLGGFGTGVSTTTAVQTTTASIGLGGLPTSTPSSTATATKTEQAPKEQLLPNEIQQTVDNFKNVVKQQKSYSSDVARSSVKEFRKVEADIDGLNNMLNEVEKQLQVNRNIAEKLKYDTAKGLQQVEMAQRTYDTPIGLQYENTMPLHFFIDLADTFEREMQNMRLQIESTDKYIKDNGKSTPLTHQDLVMGMRRIHQIFVALAGHLQALHTQVDSQKEQYLNFRKYMLNDATNVFENSHKETEKTINQIKSFTLKQPPVLASGPTPFGNVTHPSVVQAATQNQPPPSLQSTSAFGNMLGSSGFGIGSGLAAPPYQPPQYSLLFGSPSSSSGFQLQKPPTGNKRGKQ